MSLAEGGVGRLARARGCGERRERRLRCLGLKLWNSGDITGDLAAIEMDSSSFFNIQLHVALLHLLPSKAKQRPDAERALRRDAND